MARSLPDALIRRWRVFWVWRSGHRFWGRVAGRLAGIGVGPYRQQTHLAAITRHPYVSPHAEVVGLDPQLGEHAFVAERTVLARWKGDGTIALGDRTQINRDCILELFEGGSITIGAQTAIQKGCLLVSAVQPIIIHPRVQIACYCAFYSYNHGIEPDAAIFDQPLVSRGPIVIEEDAWLGVGVKVMSGVTIGRGAVVGAGSVVTRDIPSYAIAAGSPARVLRFRGQRDPLTDEPLAPSTTLLGRTAGEAVARDASRA
jgi:acetyltransferase-like isoleucine patch superfamily enzyme